jgi:hypothetical protein
MRPTFIAALALAMSAGACAAHRQNAARPIDGGMNALEWSLGGTSRMPSPPSTDAYLLRLPRGKPLDQATREMRGCCNATSFLPGPFGDPRIFLSVEGRVHVRHAPDQDAAPLEPANLPIKVGRLLAFVAATSPLEILVEAQPEDASSAQIWLLTVGERDIISIKPLKNDPALESAAAFFEKFRAPRCLKGASNCLVLSTDDRKFYLDIEPERGKRPVPLQDLGSAAVRDAAWASPDGRSLYLLMPCEDPGR